MNRYRASIIALGILAGLLMPMSAARADIISAGDVIPDPTGGAGTIVGDAMVPGLSLGTSAAGTVEVNGDHAGSTLTNTGTTFVGQSAGVEGKVIIDNGTWNNGGSFLLGLDGAGILEIRNGGTLNSNGDHVGLNPGSTGMATVDGGVWTAGSFLTIGTSGMGTVAVDNGGSVTTSSINVAFQPGSKGNFSLDHGSVLDIDTLNVGRGGLGDMTLTGASTADIAFINVGREAGGVGTMTVSGPGTVIDSGGDAVDGGFFTVGRGAGAMGHLTFEDGAVINLFDGMPGNDEAGFQTSRDGGEGHILARAGAEINVVTRLPFVAIGRRGPGDMTVESGASAHITGTDGLDYTIAVGREAGGDGTLTLREGGSMRLDGELGASGHLALGRDPGASGRLIMESGGVLDMNGTLITGLGGEGTAEIRGESRVRATFFAVGVETGSHGEMKVSGPGTTVDAVGDAVDGGFIDVGRFADSEGHVTIEDDAVVNLTTADVSADQAGFQTSRDGGEGHITVQTGAELNVSGKTPWVHIGRAGVGSMTVDSDASVHITGSDGLDYTDTIGRESGGDGTLVVRDGGTMTLDGELGAGASLAVGAATGAVGRVRLEDGGTLNVGQTLIVGDFGTGTMEMSGGSTLNAGFFQIGRNNGGDNTMTVGGSSTVNLIGDLDEGGFFNVSRAAGTKGVLTIEDDAVVNVTGGFPGGFEPGFQTSRDGGEGHMTVRNGAEVNVTGIRPFVHIGRSGVGSLAIDSGASVNITGTAGESYSDSIGRQAGGNGTVTIRDGGSMTLAGEGGATGSLVLGRDAGAHGNLRVDQGGALKVDGSLEVAGLGTGTATVLGSGVIAAGVVNVNAGGLLAGDGTVDGAVFNNGGIVAPGASPGTLRVDGHYVQNDGVLEIQIAGPLLLDRLDITGTAAFFGGSIVFDFIEGFLPRGGYAFDFLVATGGVEAFDGVTAEYLNLTSRFVPELLVFGDRLTLLVTDVPEPATLLMTALGITVLVSRRRRPIA